MAGRLHADRRFFSGMATALALLIFSLPSPCLAGQVEARSKLAVRRPAPPAAAAVKRIPSFTLKKYANLPELIVQVCQNAQRIFAHFYGQAAVKVQPFVFITGSGEKRFSPMGAALADQMLAMINDQPNYTAIRGPEVQRLRGVLFEMDGYLRIHISGINAAHQRRSYTAQVEMSEPLYRALYADTF